MLYLLVAKYRNEAERKRLEYVIDKLRDRIKAVKPSGSIWIIDADPEIARALLEEVLARVPSERVQFYRLEDPGVSIESRNEVLLVHTTMSPHEVWGALSLILARLRGVLVSEAAGVREYAVRPRGGFAKVRVRVHPMSEGSLIKLNISGYGNGFYRIVSSLKDELNLLGEVRSSV